jgi:6,7-dimethyl-8-ribityllumazine synthase
MDLAVDRHLAIGNGIITVENEDQAHARADKTRKDKGGFAARAAMTMVGIRNDLGSNS